MARGRVGAADVVLVRTGWGKANAASSTAVALERVRPALVVMVGVAGGFAPMESGDVVVSGETYQHDLGKKLPSTCDPAAGAIPCPFEVWRPQTPTETDYPPGAFVTRSDLSAVAARAARSATFTPWQLPAACQCAMDGTPKRGECDGPLLPVGRHPPLACIGTMATGDEFLADLDTAARLALERHTVTVDMETAAVAQEAATRQIPFLAVRMVADVVSATGESLYYCLMPQARTRLASVMAEVLPALAHALGGGSAAPPHDGESLACPAPELHVREPRPRAPKTHAIRLR
jgi:nucleoside phosphorylase